MELVNRADLPQVELRTERVTVESLGGDVLVRGRMLGQSLYLAQLRAGVSAKLDGENDDEAAMRAGAEYASAVLACQVLAADEKPLMTAQQWATWGGSHALEFNTLYDAAMRVSGDRVEDVQKN
jgi:hypothetical protein